MTYGQYSQGKNEGREVTMRTCREMTDGDIGFVREVYTESFPEQERRPWERVISPSIKGCPELEIIYAGDKPAGLLSWWSMGEMDYIEHFAVSRDNRGKGIGGEALDEFVAGRDKPVVVEVERATSPARAEARRVEFYIRHGFFPLDYPYIQPPYAPGLPEVEMTLMSTDPGLSPERVARMLYERVYERAYKN